MGSRSFNVVVVLFWLSTMTWLVVFKVLPPLQIGDPPDYRSVLAVDDSQPADCWLIRLDEQPIGWAVTQAVRAKDDMVALHSRVYFQHLPVDRLATKWLGAFVGPMLRQFGNLEIDIRSRMDFDPLYRPVGFESKMSVANLPEAIRMHGTIDGSQMKMSLHAGDFTYKTERYLPPNSLVMEELRPQSQLRRLRLGQTWAMPVYSPFRPASSPVEVLQATVERRDPIVWDGVESQALLVVYRGDSGASLLVKREARGRLWVRPDGVILKQEVSMYGTRLQFLRLDPAHAEPLQRSLVGRWWSDWQGPAPDELLDRLR